MSVCVYHCVPVRVRVRLQRILAAVEKQFFPRRSEKHGKCGQKCPAPSRSGHKNTGREPHSHTHTRHC